MVKKASFIYRNRTWFNSFVKRWSYPNGASAFYNIDDINPALRVLEENIDVIKQEVETLLENYTLPSYENVDPTTRRAATRYPGAWRVFFLYAIGTHRVLDKNRALCPRTCALLDTIPFKFTAFFSHLPPYKSIPAHRGDHQGVLRYHLGVSVPAEHPPLFRIGSEFYEWKQGEAILFDDLIEHEIYNDSNHPRTVLIIDIFRPLPKLIHLLNVFVSKYIAGTLYLRRIYKNAGPQK